MAVGRPTKMVWVPKVNWFGLSAPLVGPRCVFAGPAATETPSFRSVYVRGPAVNCGGVPVMRKYVVPSNAAMSFTVYVAPSVKVERVNGAEPHTLNGVGIGTTPSS